MYDSLPPPSPHPAPTALSALQQQQLDQAAAAIELSMSTGNPNLSLNIGGSAMEGGTGLATGEGVSAGVITKIQEKLQAVNEERGTQQDVATLQQEENVSISGSNARLMVMKKLSRKSEVCVCGH